jgi:hypothetical protein
MKRRFTFLFLSFFLLLGVQANAQETNMQIDSALRPKAYISAHVSTQGLGLELKLSPKPEYNIRVGASILPFEFNTVYTVSSQPTDVDMKADFANAHLMFDWHPFLNENSLSRKVVITAGAAYFWKAQGDAVVSYRGVYNYGDIQIPSEDLGQLFGTVKWNKVAPYLGFGFENAFPSRKFNIGFAVGAYYMGAPDVSLTGTKFLVRNNANEAQFRDNMSYYQVMPVVQINLNFAL